MNEKKNSEKVRQLYIMSGLTYEELSKLTGIRQNTLACWITGRRNPPDYVVDLIRAKINQYKQSIEERENKGKGE